MAVICLQFYTATRILVWFVVKWLKKPGSSEQVQCLIQITEFIEIQ